MGVYRIRSILNGRSLVGRSVDLPSMLNRERAPLRLEQLQPFDDRGYAPRPAPRR